MKKNNQGFILAAVAILLLVAMICMDAFMSSADDDIVKDDRRIVHVSGGTFYTPIPTEKSEVIVTETTPEPPKVNISESEEFVPIKECTWSKRTQYRLSKICEKYNISFEMAIAQAYQESRFNEKAVGDGGLAYGAWQIHPSTWRKELARWGYSWNDMYDVEKACEAYCKIMVSHFEKWDNIYFTLMAWRWGGDDGREKLERNGPDAYSCGIEERAEYYENRLS